MAGGHPGSHKEGWPNFKLQAFGPRAIPWVAQGSGIHPRLRLTPELFPFDQSSATKFYFLLFMSCNLHMEKWTDLMSVDKYLYPSNNHDEDTAQFHPAEGSLIAPPSQSRHPGGHWLAVCLHRGTSSPQSPQSALCCLCSAECL